MSFSFTSPATKQIRMVKNARILFEMNCVPGDNVVIITDSDMDPNVWQAIAAASNDYGCETTVMFMGDPREYHGAQPPSCIIEASKHAKIAISNTSKEYHTGGFHMEACKLGVGWVVMEQVTADILASAACDPEIYREMVKVAPKLYDKMKKAGTWHITNDSGTDYTVRAIEGIGRIETPKVVGASWVPEGLVAFPAGEIAGDPIPGTGEGIMVWDVSVHHPPGLLRQPIKLTIEKGIVKKIEGGIEAQQLREFIQKYGDENTYKFDVELSIGWNPKCPFTGNFRTDKKHYGKIHTAMGPIGSTLHIDGVTRDVSITIDDEPFMTKGRINFPPLDTWPERYTTITL